MKSFTTILAISFFVGTYAFPASMLEGANLDPEILAKFEAVKRNPLEADRLFYEHQATLAKRDPAVLPKDAENVLDKSMNPIKNLLTHGGGLNALGGFRPFTGALSGILLPKVIPQGLKLIPGNDKKHRFIAPGPNDQRGMCPTLNTLANHGYVSRDGISSFKELTEAIQEGYGFSFSLSAFLSAVGLLAGGDLPTGQYSIGGADSRVPNTIGPANGLDSHGVFEIDGSITRQDTYYGNSILHNNANFLKPRWDKYVEISKKYDGLFNIDTQAEDNGYKYDVSKATNPEFFAGGIWFVVSHAERVFVYTGLANGTNVNNATYDNVAPFFLDERFPPQWFRRPYAHSLPAAFQQAGEMFLKNPRTLGQNQGVGNFAPLGVDPSDFSPADFGCFLVKNFFDLAPDQISHAAATHLGLYKGFFAGAVLPFFTNDGFFNCNITEFTEPSESAVGSGKKSSRAAGTPVNGKYPKYGYIKQDQPLKT